MINHVKDWSMEIQHQFNNKKTTTKTTNQPTNQPNPTQTQTQTQTQPQPNPTQSNQPNQLDIPKALKTVE